MSLKLQSKNQVDSTDLESVLDASGVLNQQRDQIPETKKIESKRGRQVISQRTNSLLGVQIVSSGSYVPDNVVTNQDLQERFGFDPEWIEQRTGILERRHAPPEMATSDLCYEAAQKAIRAARVNPEDI
ncbi:MAG: ketoacyl-ACP synthase III, partial [Gimesia sp.]|nr:ketoacyl-ACP synthase III [Gimesia sp.]